MSRSLKMPRADASKMPLVWAEVRLANLAWNLQAIRKSLAAPGTGILAIVKADAYGHGMKAVAAELWRGGVRFFGVANVDEAVELRGLLPAAAILVLGSFHKSQVPSYTRHRIVPTVSSLEDAGHFTRALKKGARFPVHLKVDTGMGRLGVWHEDAAPLFKALAKEGKLSVDGLYTHFSSADGDRRFTEEQFARFERAIAKAAAAGLKPRFFHAANSMGLARFKRSHLNLVRPGIVLYGINPSKAALAWKPRPVLSLKARISFMKDVAKGRTISYGATHVTRRPTRVATLPVGYSHGYRVAFSNKASVLVRGRRCPVIGRVTMDQTLIDVGAAARAARWDEVTLIGRDGRAFVSAEELATLAGTIPYEILCSIHSRIPRYYR
jgi:alanine racemase